MRISPIIFWIQLWISCSTSDDEMSPVMMMPDEEMEIDEPVVAPVELIIDTTDLAHLPRDLGGSHVAYPLRTAEAVIGHYAYTPSGYEDHEGIRFMTRLIPIFMIGCCSIKRNRPSHMAQLR